MDTYFHPINETYSSKMEVAQRYYSIVFSIYGIPITKQELSFVSHIAINGGIFTIENRDSFITQFSVSKAAIYNMISKLKKNQVLIKGPDKKIYINKPIRLNPNALSLVLNIKLKTLEAPETSK